MNTNTMSGDLLVTIDRIFDKHGSRDVRDAAEAGQWPAGLWQALDDVGLTRCALTEEEGGFGTGLQDAALILRRCAYHAAPVPLAETMLAGRLLSSAGLEVPPGALTVGPVVRGDRLEIVDGKAGPALFGCTHRIPWGDACAHIVVVAQHEGRTVVALAAIRDCKARAEKNLAGEPRCELRFDAVPVMSASPLDGAGAQLENEGALFRSVQIAGALERILELSLRYANERVQFGRPIGKFQAVQHMLAMLAGQVAACSAAVDIAVDGDAGIAVETAVAIAKARAGEAAGRGAEIAHQVHGAMGFTREHPLHYSTRRLWSWRDEFGNENYWQARLGRMVAGRGADTLWPLLTSL